MKKSDFRKITALLLVMFFVGLTLQSCKETKPLTQAEMEGYWVLKTMNGKDAKTEFTGALPTLEFNFDDNLISGTGGCNRYKGAFSYKDGNFSAPNLATTQMLCTEDNNEGQFILELTNVNNTLSLVNGLLTISHDGKVVLEFEKGTSPIENDEIVLNSESLSGLWKLKVIDGVEAQTKYKGERESIPTLSFNFADNKITGNSGCNTYNATFSLNADQLIVGALMSTRMACPNLEGEMQYSQAIADTSSISLATENYLQIAKKGIVLLEFEKVTDSSSIEAATGEE